MQKYSINDELKIYILKLLIYMIHVLILFFVTVAAVFVTIFLRRRRKTGVLEVAKSGVEHFKFWENGLNAKADEWHLLWPAISVVERSKFIWGAFKFGLNRLNAKAIESHLL